MVNERISDYEPSEDTSPDMADTIYDLIWKSVNIELGGFYAGDHMYLSVPDDTILITEYGMWD